MSASRLGGRHGGVERAALRLELFGRGKDGGKVLGFIWGVELG